MNIELESLFNEAVKNKLRHIIDEETDAAVAIAKENIERRISECADNITMSMIERINFEVSEKQIVFKIKPNH